MLTVRRVSSVSHALEGERRCHMVTAIRASGMLISRVSGGVSHANSKVECGMLISRVSGGASYVDSKAWFIPVKWVFFEIF